MIDFYNETTQHFDIDLCTKIAATQTKQSIELILTDNKKIKKLNADFREKNEPTDVLSFPYEPMPHMPLGTIIISIDFAKKKALELGHSVEEEIALLFTHGLLHLLGFDHECDHGEHRTQEEAIIAQFGLAKSLIVRNSE